MNTIGAFFGAIYDGTIGFFTEALRLILAFCRAVWSFQATVIAFIVAGFALVFTAINGVISIIQNVVSNYLHHTLPSQLNESYLFINSILPLTETFNFFVAIIAAKAVCMAYRFLKSWVPTVS